MADTIPDHYQIEFSKNWITRIQQEESFLGKLVPQESIISGNRKRYDRAGSTTSRRVAARKADTVWDDGSDDFRWATYGDPYVLTKLLDQYDEQNLGALVLPNTQYIQAHAYTYQRDMDRAVISTLLDPATINKDGNATLALPAGQKIVAGGTGLTLAKLLKARELMAKASIPSMGRYIVCAPEDITSLLNTVEVKSADYNTVKALAAGEVGSFLGFQFVEHPDALPVSAGTRSCVAFYAQAGSDKSAVKMIYHQKGTTIDRIALKSNATGIQTHYRIGGARIHDEAVVQIDVVA